ncbi:glycosyl hydrolase family 65 protein [Glaciibacter superstes]|uniref:glycosyl hydrolase family 65 protein n=1 Tax=Glaciibacter superstes TaxID=501023 RepID=UPI000A0601BE
MFNPVLPPELPRVLFSIIYRTQPIRVLVTPDSLRLTLDACDAAPGDCPAHRRIGWC